MFGTDQLSSIKYYPLPNRLTMVCEVKLKNGFTLVGHAACTDESIPSAMRVAREEAMAKLLLIEKYVEAETAFRVQQTPQPPGAIAVIGRVLKRLLRRSKKVARRGNH